ncbi:MAG: hypothetical protein HKL80_05025 [Acidimicrobiales bacterium]|nr:hypothetical protein [Acidimicrobiales bacterium]
MTYYVTTFLFVVLGMAAGGLALSTGDPQALWPSLIVLGSGLCLAITILLFEYSSITVAENDQWTFRALLRNRCIRVDKIANMRRLQIYGIGGVRILKLSMYDAESKKLNKLRLLTTSEISRDLGLGRFGYRRANWRRSDLKQDITIDDELSREQFLKAFVL